MYTGIFIYLLIGFVLVLQHFFRFYYVNKFMYKSKRELLIESGYFYFALCLLWVFGIDFLIEVKDYKRIIKEV
jgi:hypothetical protein